MNWEDMEIKLDGKVYRGVREISARVSSGEYQAEGHVMLDPAFLCLLGWRARRARRWARARMWLDVALYFGLCASLVWLVLDFLAVP